MKYSAQTEPWAQWFACNNIASGFMATISSKRFKSCFPSMWEVSIIMERKPLLWRYPWIAQAIFSYMCPDAHMKTPISLCLTGFLILFTNVPFPGCRYKMPSSINELTALFAVIMQTPCIWTNSFRLGILSEYFPSLIPWRRDSPIWRYFSREVPDSLGLITFNLFIIIGTCLCSMLLVYYISPIISSHF